MLDKETQQKIASCKALQGKTIADVCESERFLSNLAAYMKAQQTDRAAIRSSYDAMRKLGGAKGYKLPAHVIDRVIELTTKQFAAAYLEVLRGVSARPVAERNYIRQLGNQAYNLTVAQIVTEEFPELKSTFFSKTN